MRGVIQAGVCCCLLAQAAAAGSSGIADIDEMRKSVAASPTTDRNAVERLPMLYSWFRLLLHQGIDMLEFEAVRLKLGRGTPSPETCRAIDEGYAVLGKIQANPHRIAAKLGPAPAPASGTDPTDWPLFHGNAAQTGYSRDPGPSQGKLAWRFPIGHAWYARPSVAGGRVYVASPGLYTIAYALDEKTGTVLWKARQNGQALYLTPRVSSGVVVLKDKVVVRETGSGGEVRNARHLIYIDKNTGKVLKREVAGHVDYRRSYAPVAGDDRYLVFARGYQWIQGRPPLVWMLNTVVLKEAESGKTLWELRVGDIFGEPVLEGERVYVAAEPGVLYALNAAGSRRVAWQFNAGSALRGTPAVVEDTVYIGANDGTLYALEKESGRLKWKQHVAEAEPRAFQFFSTATASGGKIFAGAADRNLYCLDAGTGRLLWRKQSGDWIRSRPAVVGDLVYVAAMDGTVSALRIGDGSLAWRRQAGEHQILADLVANENGVLVSSSDLYLHSFHPKDGTPQWRQSLLESATVNGERVQADVIAGGADYQSSPVVVAGKAYIGGPNHFVYSIDAASGKEIWRFETSGQVSGSPVFAEGRVYFGQQGGDKDFYAVEASTGRPIWKRPLGWGWVGAGYSEGKLYIGTVEGEIHCVTAADGRLVWTHGTNGGVYPSPATDTNNVYTGSWDGHFFGLDKRSGEMRWAYHLGGVPDSAAAVLWKGKLLIQSLSKHLVALDAATGVPTWEYMVPAGFNINATPAAHGDRVYTSIYMDANSGPIGARLLALNDADGRVEWEYRGAGALTGAAIGGGRVYAGSTTDVFFTALDAKGDGNGTTDVIWRYKLGAGIEESCPAIYGRRAFVLCSDRYLYAFE